MADAPNPVRIQKLARQPSQTTITPPRIGATTGAMAVTVVTTA